MKTDKEMYKKIRGLILLAGLVLVVVLNISSVISGVSFVIGILYPFLLGCCIAFVLNLPMSFFERVLFQNKKMKDKKFSRIMGRPISLILSGLIALAVILFVIFFLIPKMTGAASNLSDTLKNEVPKWYAWLEGKFAKYPSVVVWIQNHDFSSINWTSVLDEVLSVFKTGSSTTIHNFLTVAQRIIGQAANICIAIAFALYICAAKETHKRRCLGLIYSSFPKKAADEILKVAAKCNDTFRRFITGQCLECICVALLVGTVMAITGMPYSFLIVILCSVCCFIPMFGAVIAGVLGAVVVLTASPARMLAFIIIYIAIRIFDDNFMYPRIMGNSINMPSVFVLIAITVGGALFGFGGMLFFIPLTSVLYNLAKDGVERRMKKKGIQFDDSDKVVFGIPSAPVNHEKINEPKQYTSEGTPDKGGMGNDRI